MSEIISITKKIKDLEINNKFILNNNINIDNLKIIKNNNYVIIEYVNNNKEIIEKKIHCPFEIKINNINVIRENNNNLLVLNIFCINKKKKHHLITFKNILIKNINKIINKYEITLDIYWAHFPIMVEHIKDSNLLIIKNIYGGHDIKKIKIDKNINIEIL